MTREKKLTISSIVLWSLAGVSLIVGFAIFGYFCKTRSNQGIISAEFIALLVTTFVVLIFASVGIYLWNQKGYEPEEKQSKAISNTEEN